MSRSRLSGPWGILPGIHPNAGMVKELKSYLFEIVMSDAFKVDFRFILLNFPIFIMVYTFFQGKNISLRSVR